MADSTCIYFARHYGNAIAKNRFVSTATKAELGGTGIPAYVKQATASTRVVGTSLSAVTGGESSRTIAVQYIGLAYVEAGEALLASDYVVSDANGRAIKATTAPTSQVCGIALYEQATVQGLVAVLLVPQLPQLAPVIPPGRILAACATTSNITLSGLQTIDSHVGAADDIVLVKNQTTQSQNGVYQMKSGAWVRLAEADTAAELAALLVHVDKGSNNRATIWMAKFSSNNTVGSTNLVWHRMNWTDGTGLLLEPSYLEARLRVSGSTAQILDANGCQENGWYIVSGASGANVPAAGKSNWCILVTKTTFRVFQTAWSTESADGTSNEMQLWYRWMYNDGENDQWTAWVRLNNSFVPESDANRTPVTETVGASPWVINNESGTQAMEVAISGGTVSAVELSVNAATTWNSFGVAPGIWTLMPGESIRVTYSVVPTVKTRKIMKLMHL